MKTFLAIVIMNTLLVSCGQDVQIVSNVVLQPSKISPISCKLYDIAGLGFVSIPSFESLDALTTFNPASFNDESSPNTEVFSSMTDLPLPYRLTENFGLACAFKLTPKKSGLYTFKTISDEGSKLYVNGVLVVTNDGLHAMLAKIGTKTLTAGVVVNVKLDYFNGIGPKGLIVTVKEPNASVEFVVEESKL